MGQHYIKAAIQLSELADEFSDCDDICSILRGESVKLTKLGITKGALVKEAEEKEKSIATK